MSGLHVEVIILDLEMKYDFTTDERGLMEA